MRGYFGEVTRTFSITTRDLFSTLIGRSNSRISLTLPPSVAIALSACEISSEIFPPFCASTQPPGRTSGSRYSTSTGREATAPCNCPNHTARGWALSRPMSSARPCKTVTFSSPNLSTTSAQNSVFLAYGIYQYQSQRGQNNLQGNAGKAGAAADYQ